MDKTFEEYKKDAVHIKEYLKLAFLTEAMLNSIEKVISELNRRASLLAIPHQVIRGSVAKESALKSGVRAFLISIIPVFILNFLFWYFCGDVLLKKFFEEQYYELLNNKDASDSLLIPWVVVCVAIGVMQFIRTTLRNNREEDAVRWSYSKNVENEKVRLQMELRRKNYLNQEIARLEKRKLETQDTLKMIYQKNILHSDYRDLIPTGTIFGYFETGRVVSLESNPYEKGAYNLYEEEARANIIITQLSAIYDNIEKIRRGQYKIYEALTGNRMEEREIFNLTSNTHDSGEKGRTRVGAINEEALLEYNKQLIKQNQNIRDELKRF